MPNRSVASNSAATVPKSFSHSGYFGHYLCHDATISCLPDALAVCILTCLPYAGLPWQSLERHKNHWHVVSKLRSNKIGLVLCRLENFYHSTQIIIRASVGLGCVSTCRMDVRNAILLTTYCTLLTTNTM